MRHGRGVTIEEIAAGRNVSADTVRGDRGRNRSTWPAVVGYRRTGGSGRPEFEYDAAQVEAFYRAKESANFQARRGPRRLAGRWNPEDRVDDRTAAARLRISYDSVRSYPAVYARSENPFPVKGSDGFYRWGDLTAWDDRRPGSGPHGKIPERVPAGNARRHLAALEKAGARRTAIASASGVPPGRLRSIADGQAQISRSDEAALLATTAAMCAAVPQHRRRPASQQASAASPGHQPGPGNAPARQVAAG